MEYRKWDISTSPTRDGNHPTPPTRRREGHPRHTPQKISGIHTTEAAAHPGHSTSPRTTARSHSASSTELH